MKVFLSWSGVRSKYIAESLRGWIPRVIQAVKPWMSDIDIPAGARWQGDIADELDEANFGVICVTQENMHKPWLMFEAGALSKSMKASHVCPLVYSMELGALSGPIAQFQANLLNEDGVFQVLKAINSALPENSLDAAHLKDQFDVMWPRLQQMLASIPKEPVVPSPLVTQPFETAEAVLEFLQANIPNKKLPDGKPSESKVWVGEQSAVHNLLKPRSLRYAPVSTLEGAIIGLTPQWAWNDESSMDEASLRELVSQVSLDLDKWYSAGYSIPFIALDLCSLKDLPADIINILLGIGFRYPNAVEVGLSEEFISIGSEEIQALASKLKKGGLKIGLRNFGTGYSSLSFLKRLTMDTLWIDRSFVQRLSGGDHSKDDAAIVTAITQLGHHMNTNVIAEGVSNAEQIKFLLEIGVKIVSGSVAGDSMSSEQVFEKIRT
jgi:EAL domain-containing protein (putative c-di-GMP-specific phosphodiesterase class I)